MPPHNSMKHPANALHATLGIGGLDGVPMCTLAISRPLIDLQSCNYCQRPLIFDAFGLKFRCVSVEVLTDM